LSLAGVVLTSLEMTSPSELVPGRPPPAPIEMDEVRPGSADVLRALYVRIGAPHGWTGRTLWSQAQWQEELSRPGVRAWVARVNQEVAGFVELEGADESGTSGIIVFGLVPEFVGKGFGGAFLTDATLRAWDLISADGRPTTRVVVETASFDHPNALRNYEARGFRVFRTA
jgi:GNAT superfamily N-acetyltransferase